MGSLRLEQPGIIARTSEPYRSGDAFTFLAAPLQVGGFVCVGRILLSEAFEIGFAFDRVLIG